MARIGTPNLNLGTYLDGENPGAGSQTVDSVGLNGDRIKTDTALGTQHNANGTHKNDVIDGPSLKTTAADASTVELAGSPLKLRVKDDGLDGIKLKASVTDGDTLEASAATGAKAFRIKDAGVKASKIRGTGAGKAVDQVGIEVNGSGELQLKDNGVTAAKIVHDNNRTKFIVTMSCEGVSQYAKVNTVQLTAAMGLPMPRAGCVTKAIFITSDGTQHITTIAYVTTGNPHFNAGEMLFAAAGPVGTGTNTLTKSGGYSIAATAVGTAGQFILVIEIEFDN